MFKGALQNSRMRCKGEGKNSEPVLSPGSGSEHFE